MKDVKELVESFKNDDGEINWEKANEAYNKNINDIVVSKVSKETEKAQQEATNKVFNELGIEADTLEDAKVWAKRMNGKTDEFKERNAKLEKQLKELQGVSDELNKYKQQATQTSQINKLLAKGVDAEQAEFLQYKFNKQVDEDTSFDDIANKYFEENEPKPKSTNKFVKNKKTSGDEVDPSIKKRYKYFQN